MHAGLQHHAAGSRHGLRRQLHRDFACQASAYSALCQGLDDDIDVGGAASGQTGDGVHLRFRHLHGGAHPVEQGAHRGQRRGQRRRPGTHRRGPGAEPDEGLRHDAHHRLAGTQMGFEGRRRHPRHDGDDDLRRVEVCGQRGQHIRRDLRLERDDDEFCRSYGRQLAGRGHALLRQRREQFFAQIDGGQAGRREAGGEQTGEQTTAHVAGADDGDGALRRGCRHQRYLRSIRIMV